MGDEVDDDRGDDAEREEWPRDTKVDEAKSVLIDWFEGHPDQVFYGRQIAVLHEKQFYHWITTKAVNTCLAGRG